MTSPSPALTRLGAFGAAVSGSAYTIRHTWEHAPSSLGRLIGANLLLAAAPAAQVVAVGRLARSVAAGSAFLPWLVLLTILVGVGQALDMNTNLAHQRVRTRMRSHFLDRLMRAVAALPPAKLAEPGTNAAVQGCRSSVRDLGHLVGSVISAAAAVVAAGGLCVTVWVISPLAGLLVVAALVPTLLVFAWQAQMQDREFVPVAEWQRRSEYAIEQLVAQRTGTELATLGSGQVAAEIISTTRRRADNILDRILVALIRSSAIAGMGTALLLGGALAAIVITGGGGAGIAAGIVGVLSGVAATRGAGFAFGDLMACAPKVQNFRRFVDDDRRAEVVHIRGCVDRLAVHGLTVRYPRTERPAVVDVSLQAEKGQMIALVGVNGAGKTTTINAIMGLVDATAGMITIDGVDADELGFSARLGCFGLLTQEFGRYEFTVRDVVRIGRPDGSATDAELWRALDSAHAGHFVRTLPDGLDTQLGPQFGGVGLSGGQWQRLALARIYLRDAPVWVLDEPTSAIDAEAEQQIFAELQRGKADRVTIVVSHRAWTLKDMDHIYVFDHGRIIENGSYAELLDRGGRFAEIFVEQVG